MSEERGTPETTGLDPAELTRLLARQDGVVSRRQVRELGAGDHDLARLLRRRELVRLHPGVYVDHTGTPSWQQRAWAAVLVHWPAALARESALPAAHPTGPVHVAIDVRRTVRTLPGVVVHRTAGFPARTHWVASPPRIRIEHAVLDVVQGLEPGAALNRLAAVCHTRRTTAGRIREVLLTRRGLAHRELLLELLDDLDRGVCSVLEREYLLRVERPHGFPPAERQLRTGSDGHRVYQDVRYEAQAIVVELDGRAYHDDAETRDRDSARDLEAAVSGGLRTVRLTYGQVLDHGCETAAAVGVLLQRAGWSGPLVRCPACSEVGSLVAHT